MLSRMGGNCRTFRYVWLVVFVPTALAHSFHNNYGASIQIFFDMRTNSFSFPPILQVVRRIDESLDQLEILEVKTNIRPEDVLSLWNALLLVLCIDNFSQPCAWDLAHVVQNRVPPLLQPGICDSESDVWLVHLSRVGSVVPRVDRPVHRGHTAICVPLGAQRSSSWNHVCLGTIGTLS